MKTWENSSPLALCSVISVTGRGGRPPSPCGPRRPSARPAPGIRAAPAAPSRPPRRGAASAPRCAARSAERPHEVAQDVHAHLRRALALRVVGADRLLQPHPLHQPRGRSQQRALARPAGSMAASVARNSVRSSVDHLHEVRAPPPPARGHPSTVSTRRSVSNSGSPARAAGHQLLQRGAADPPRGIVDDAPQRHLVARVHDQLR
jgi:hypothetical protein